MAGRLLAGVKAELRAQVADARTLATAVVGDLEQVLAERPGDMLVRVYVNLEDYVHLHGVAAACTVRKLGRGL